MVWTDVDMSYPNDEIPMLVKELDGYDQVVGARRTEEGTRRFFRVPAKWFIRRLASYLTDTEIPDLNSGLRAFRRDVGMQYVHHLPAGFSCVTTLTMSFLANGYSVKYVPIDYRPRAGTSKFHWWRDTKRYLLQVVRMSLSYNPLKVFLPIGLVLLAVGLAKLVLRLGRQGLPPRRQHPAHPVRVAAGDHGRPARRSRGPGDQAPVAGPTGVNSRIWAGIVPRAHLGGIFRNTWKRSRPESGIRVTVPTGNTYDKYGTDEPDRAADDAGLHGRPRWHARTGSRPGGSSRSASARGTSRSGSANGSPRRRSSASTCPTMSSPGSGGRPISPACSATRRGCRHPTARSTSCSRSRFSSTSRIRTRPLDELARVCAGTLIASVPFEPIWRAGNLARGRYVRDLGNTPGHVNHWTRWGFTRFVSTRFDVERVRNPLPWTMVLASVRR